MEMKEKTESSNVISIPTSPNAKQSGYTETNCYLMCISLYMPQQSNCGFKDDVSKKTMIRN